MILSTISSKGKNKLLFQLYKVVLSFLSNVHTHAKGDKCNVLINYFKDKNSGYNVGVVIFLSKKGKGKKFLYSNSNDSSVLLPNSEGITVYQRVFFFVLKGNGIYEVLYDVNEEYWSTIRRSDGRCNNCSLLSIYGSIFFSNFNLSRYDTGSNVVATYGNSVITRFYPAFFARSARYIYMVMGYTNSKIEELIQSFSIFDVKGAQRWVTYGFPTEFKIGLCRCIQPDNDEIIIVGGEDKKAYRMVFYDKENDLKLSGFGSLPYRDAIDGTMGSVYWDGCYFLLSCTGVLYKYSKSKKVIKSAKHWMDKDIGVDPPCYGG